jgi:DNA gyrase subunit A
MSYRALCLCTACLNGHNGKLVASFPVEDSDQIMLVTDKGQLIRCPVEGIRSRGDLRRV